MAVNVTRTEGGALPLVKSYGDGGFRVAGQRYEGSILIVNGVVTAVPVTRIDDLLPEHMAAVLAADPAIEFVLMGSGPSLALAPPAVRAGLEAAQIKADPMDTGAAARTYNVLLLEDRRVAVLLIAVP
ncbi:Mth938-like domain-containing protein [Govanella unica]|uniref:Mth938-like domain-containing protein n=1 Tax=Govanella unica TaxID=2975056 RepID=A0A9X3Z7A7_9PROT|nr:Mth938-like domain-containing protein [Govania unica]MDA5193952.1 Mth938-like domain-containing protein [Govania unica]